MKTQGFKIPKKYQPAGLTILYEDRDLIVVNKSSGLLTISTESESEKTAFYRLNEYVKKGNYKSRNRVYVVHRLDRDTSGVLVFAKNFAAQEFLQNNWQQFSKIYYAVVIGRPEKNQGVLKSYLAENSQHHVYTVNHAKLGQLAETEYRVVKEKPGEKPGFSLLELKLITGRKNQIRVQLADHLLPIVGDKKYGLLNSRSDKFNQSNKVSPAGDKAKLNAKKLMLHAQSLTLMHPHLKEEVAFTTPLPHYFNHYFKFVP